MLELDIKKLCRLKIANPVSTKYKTPFKIPKFVLENQTKPAVRDTHKAVEIIATRTRFFHF